MILAAAREEFANRGFSNAFVDSIAARTHVNKRMIYYYFGSKRALYVAVLKNEYRKICDAEKSLDLDHLDPAEALRHYAEFAFDYYRDNEQFVRLVTLENVMKGRHLSASKSFKALNSPVIAMLERILTRGRRKGVFRDGVNALDLHHTVSALGFFYFSNRYTFGAIFSLDMRSDKSFQHRKSVTVDTVLRYVSR